MQCEAKSKRTGERCNGRAVIGRRHCRMHGGTQPRGVDSPNYKNGRYPRAFQGEFLERYEQLVSDPDLLSTREEIAALILRIDDLLVKARAAAEHAEELAAGPKVKGTAALLRSAITAEDRSWSRIDRALNTLAKLREVELRRLEKLRAFITLEQAQALMRALARSVQERASSGLTGQVLIDAIHRDLVAIVPALPSGAPGDHAGYERA